MSSSPEKPFVKTILTHTFPDLDAMLSVMLVKRFGHKLFEGIDEAEIDFAPAGKLPGNKSPEALLAHGILCVDIGGGQFDTHPQGVKVDESKLDRAAADLVAEGVGVLEDPNWAELIEYTRRQDTKAEALQSRDYVHLLSSLPTIINGINLRHEADSHALLKAGIAQLEAIPAYKEHGDPENTGIELLKTWLDRFAAEEEGDFEEPEPAWKNLAAFRKRLKDEPEKAFSSHPLDDIVSLKALALGHLHLNGGDKEKAWLTFRPALEALIEREKRWEQALEDFDNVAQVHKMRKVSLVAIEDANGMLIKAARFKAKADLIVYRDPSIGAVSFLINRRGPLRHFSMDYLAAKIRLAEYRERGKTQKNIEYEDLMEFGTVNGWFLHQSGNLLVRGSKKMPEFDPSRIPMERLVAVAKSEINATNKLPEPYCPDNLCNRQFCIFYDMHFKTCKSHRYKLRNPEG